MGVWGEGALTQAVASPRAYLVSGCITTVGRGGPCFIADS